MAAISSIRSKAVSVPRIVSARSLVRRSVLVTSESLSTGWREQIRDGATEVVGELPRVLDGNGPVPLAGDIADVGLRQADGVRDGHLRDSRHRDRLRHAVGAWRGAQNRELLLGQYLEIGLHVPGPSPGSQRDATVAPGDIALVKADERPMRIRRSESSASRRACRNDSAAGTTGARHVTPPPWPLAAMPSTSASGQQQLGAVPPSSSASAW